MTSNLKNQIDSKPEELKFIKTSDLPLDGLSDQQKVALNRKANALFNEGKVEMAKRIFITLSPCPRILQYLLPLIPKAHCPFLQEVLSAKFRRS